MLQIRTAAKLPVPTENPLQEALDNYLLMSDRVAALEDQAKVLNSANVDLMRENDFLRSEVTKLRSERDRLQGYSIDLTTRINVIVETCNSAVNEARKFAVKPVVSDVHQDDAEQASAREIIASLPERLLPDVKFGG